MTKHEAKVIIALAQNKLSSRDAARSLNYHHNTIYYHCCKIRKATGLDPKDFLLYTTYENSCHCKPNPAYYEDVLAAIGADPRECLMVGNDVQEDMIARELGMEVFLLTDCLLDRKGTDLSQYPHGGFPELLELVKSL